MKEQTDLDVLFKTATYNGVDFQVNASGTAVFFEGNIKTISSVAFGRRIGKVKSFKHQDCTYFVGKLVALAFVANPNNYPLAIKKNQNSEDDSYTNMVWGTSKTIHKIRVDLKLPVANNNGYKIPNERKVEITERLERGEKTGALAKEFGVSVTAIIKTWDKICGKDKKRPKNITIKDSYKTEVIHCVRSLLDKGHRIVDIATETGIATELIYGWGRLTETEVLALKTGEIGLSDFKHTERGDDPDYTTLDLTNMFDVRAETVWHWCNNEKLTPYGKDRMRYGANLFRQSDIVAFILRTHNGDYAPSSIDVKPALKYMGLEKEVILPLRWARKQPKVKGKIILPPVKVAPKEKPPRKKVSIKAMVSDVESPGANNKKSMKERRKSMEERKAYIYRLAQIQFNAEE